MPKIAVYPGTFDPLTSGHEDLVKRATRIFDEIVVAVALAGHKHPFFDLDERVAIAQRVFATMPNVRVVGFSGLLMDFVASQHSHIVLRGLRAVSDFEYEFQLAGMNRNLDPKVETVFMTPAEQFMFVSASMVREIAMLGGDVSPFVHPLVVEKLNKKIQEQL
ncbi:MAG: pantetheine-phosphate adenylyltransferase [Sulfuriferula sp.]